VSRHAAARKAAAMPPASVPWEQVQEMMATCSAALAAKTAAAEAALRSAADAARRRCDLQACARAGAWL
jgi:hypothetical protein